MKSLVTIFTFVLLLATGLAPIRAAGSQAVDCAAIEEYLVAVDTQMAEEVHALVTRPGWAEDARGATILMNTGGSDASAGEIEAIIEFLTIPGDVLSGIDESAIPGGATAFHESALGFWSAFPEWAGASASDDEETWEASFASLGDASQENLAARGAIDEECAGLLDSFLQDTGTITLLFETLEWENADLEVLTNASLEDFRGIGIFFMLMPGNLSGAFTQPAPVSPLATPGSTPVIVIGQPDSTPES